MGAPPPGYMELVESHGPLAQRIRFFLMSEGVPVYDLEAVERYMDRLALRVGKAWAWHPLRPTDTGLRRSWHLVETRPPASATRWQRFWFQSQSLYCGEVANGQYDRLLPLEMLRRVQLLHRRFGDEIKVHVTDYTSKRPDPFICAMAAGIEPIVFGVWDEPGFGG